MKRIYHHQINLTIIAKETFLSKKIHREYNKRQREEEEEEEERHTKINTNQLRKYQ